MPKTTVTKHVCTLTCQSDHDHGLTVPDCHFRSMDSVFDTGQFFCRKDGELDCPYAHCEQFVITNAALEHVEEEPPDIPLYKTEISVRLRNLLLMAGIATTRQLCKVPVRNLLLINGIGAKSIGDIRLALQIEGLKLDES